MFMHVIVGAAAGIWKSAISTSKAPQDKSPMQDGRHWLVGDETASTTRSKEIHGDH
jgi:hypothetical protein